MRNYQTMVLTKQRSSRYGTKILTKNEFSIFERNAFDVGLEKGNVFFWATNFGIVMFSFGLKLWSLN